MSLYELKQHLRHNSLKISGNKNDLILRLIENDKKIRDDDNLFNVFIKNDRKTYIIRTVPTSTILELKLLLEQQYNMAVRQQVLCVTNYDDGSCIALSDDDVLGDICIQYYNLYFKLHLILN